MTTNGAPSVNLTCDPPGPLFFISDECEMPEITVTAHISPEPETAVKYEWTVTLGFQASMRSINHPVIHQTTEINRFTIPFTEVRGGDLSVSVAVAGTTLTATTANLQVTGTNPSIAALRNAAPANGAFRKLLCLESGLRQFQSSYPLLSADNKGGAGICQITNPPPTDDQIWSWKENMRAGWELFRSKQSIARNYPAQVRASAKFAELVKEFNAQRAANGLGRLTIVLPDYTDEQLERDTLRAYNGYAGRLHEYRVKVDGNGLLAVTVDGSIGTAQWEPITAAERTALYDEMGLGPNSRGDVNYVDDVMKQPGF